LTLFGLIGFAVQAAAHATTGLYLPASLAAIPAVVGGGYLTRQVSVALGRVMPNPETSAISRDRYVVRAAVVTLGRVPVGPPGQAKLRDQHGQVHYLLIEPDQQDISFAAGETVLIVGMRGHTFLAIPAPSRALLDEQ